MPAPKGHSKSEVRAKLKAVRRTASRTEHETRQGSRITRDRLLKEQSDRHAVEMRRIWDDWQAGKLKPTPKVKPGPQVKLKRAS